MEGNRFTWDWNLFGAVGYVGVIVALAVLLIWGFYLVLKGKPILCQVALVLSVLAFGLAKVNSLTHVNRIQLDPAAEKAAFEAQQAAKRKALLESRGEEVAQIRFAEDADGDFLDRAGMDEADLKYFESQMSGEEGAPPEGGPEPAWKGEKKSRTGGAATDDSASDALESAEKKEPILMAEAEMMMANRLDTWMLKFTKLLILVALGFIVWDHLKRANRYGEAYLPLPLPSSLPNIFTRYPPVVLRPENPRRTTVEELAWFLRRGDSFLYLADDPEAALRSAKELEPITNRRLKPTEILLTEPGEEGMSFTDEFAFEVWWHGRASVVVGDAARAKALMRVVLSLLEQRRDSRAVVSQTAHLVWDLDEPIPKEWLADFERLAKRTGVSLFLCHPDSSSSEKSAVSPPVLNAPQPV